MNNGRPKTVLALSEDERAQLTLSARSGSLPVDLSARARIVLSSADGEANSLIAERFKIGQATVGKWRGRFIERRIAGLNDEMRPCASRSIDDERLAALITPRCTPSQPTAPRTGVCGVWPPRPASPKAACSAAFACSACSRTAARAPSYPPTHSSSRRSCVTWSACTWLARQCAGAVPG